MNTNQIEWLKNIVKNDCDGTFMSVLLRDDLEKHTFEGTLKFLVSALYEEKKVLIAENKRYADVLKKHNLYNPENILG